MKKEELRQLSEKILTYRAKHNLTAKQFGELCNLTMPTIYNIENCKQVPSKLTLGKILNLIEKES